MSCKCFVHIPNFRQGTTFQERLELSKCTCNARFVVSENKSRFELLECSVDEVDKYKVDNCLIQDKTQKKCDYYFHYHTASVPNLCIFVELKGSDIETAIKQIDSTISYFIQQHYFDQLTDKRVLCAIVSTGYPSDDSTFRREKKRITDKYRQLGLTIERKTFDMRFNPRTGIYMGKGEK